MVSVEPAGSTIHLFLDPDRTSPEQLAAAVPGTKFRRIVPSLEDVFIDLMRRSTDNFP